MIAPGAEAAPAGAPSASAVGTLSPGDLPAARKAGPPAAPKPRTASPGTATSATKSPRVARSGAGLSFSVSFDLIGALNAVREAALIDANREAYIEGLANAAWYGGNEHYNVMVCNLATHCGDQIPSSSAQSYGTAEYHGVYFGVWVFRQGRFDHTGDGGAWNWLMRGWFNAGSHPVEFYDPPGDRIQVMSRCVDIPNSRPNNGTALQVWDCHTRANQWWYPYKLGTTTTGYPVYAFTAEGKCMDVQAGRTDNGTQVGTYDCNGTGAQQWVFHQGSLVNVNSHKCLDLKDWGNYNGGKLQIWDCSNNANQKIALPSLP
ncbi:hypothetical protein FGW37_03610 [Streptomyces rectiverticillatus]|nr:hypothetical protein FGW37_03610 [Streptomyces rectiverticillatus]